MARLSSHYGVGSNNTRIILLLPLILLLNYPQISQSRSIVKFLPGFEGPLPFVLETGYVEVGDDNETEEDGEVFYYFIESEKNPKQDPLLVWLTGGPGCSAFSGLALEIGPLTFKNEAYNGSLPNLLLRQHSWTKVSSIIFLDLPVGTGFSYPKTESAAQQSTWKLVRHAHQFLRKWLVDHPEFLSNEVYIGGDSYSGIPVPVIVQEISIGNEGGLQPWINLQGYLLGNPVTTETDDNYKIPFNHGMGLISDELYESLQKNCKGEYKNIEAENVVCLRDMQTYKNTISGICNPHILEPKCESNNLLINPMEVPVGDRRSLITTFSSHHLTLPPLSCRGSIGKWQRCNHDIPFEKDIIDSVEYHANLSRKGYHSLIYSGDHDMLVPFLATQAWIRSLNYSIVDEWRQWYTNGQIAGYTRTYSNRMTFATVKGGGHTAPEYKPEECLGMFSRWISNNPL